MADFYVYLISSLPALQFGARPPFTSEKFVNICRDFIPDEDFAVLKSIGDTPLRCVPTVSAWREFDTQLRNELVKIRAAKKHIDPTKYLRDDGFAEPEVVHAAMNASRNPSILDAEKSLDYARWHFLDELSVGHYFDLDVLIIYALKLMILERWEKITKTDAAKTLDEVLIWQKNA